MALILNIETATPLCSVALARDGKVIAHRETFEEKSHASRLTVFIDEVLREAGISVKDLDAVASGKGPGSYTGLRIGISVVKGLCYGANIPLIAVNTLHILFHEAFHNAQRFFNPDFVFCPMIDARRMEVFTCIIDSKGNEIEPVTARIIDADSFGSLSDRTIVFFGNGMEKCRPLLSQPNHIFISDIHPHASALAPLSEKYFLSSSFEDIAYFEPFYLKDFIATVSKKGLKV